MLSAWFVSVVVVPGYYLVWYNGRSVFGLVVIVVVPGYYLVWYNLIVTF